MSSPSQDLQSDGFEIDDGEFSPAESILRNPSIFEYDLNKSLRLNLSKQKEDQEVKDSPGPFQLKPSPGPKARQMSKSKSISSGQPTSFDEF